MKRARPTKSCQALFRLDDGFNSVPRIADRRAAPAPGQVQAERSHGCWTTAGSVSRHPSEHLQLLRRDAHLLFGITPHDVPTDCAVAAILVSAGLVASYLPARRASRVDPVFALRIE